MTEVKKLVPKLRFPEFLQNEGWTQNRLKDACHVNPTSSELPERFIYIDLESVEAGKLTARKVITKDEGPSRAQRLLHHDDVIFQIVRPYQRNNFHFKASDGLEYVASTGYAQLRSIDSADFLYQAVHVDGFVDRVIAKCTGSSYPAINSSDLAEVPLALPTPNEQQKIADCLSSLDELIAAQARKVDALKTHKKGLMQQLFPREGETQPLLRFPEFRDAPNWENGSLGSIFETTSGGTPSRSEANYWGGDIPWITTSLVNFGVINGAEEFITQDGLNNSSAKVLPKGTVLVAMYGQGKTRGQVALLGVEATTNQACAAIRPKEGINPYFLFLNLASRYEEFRNLSNSGGQENLSQGLIRDFPFAYPLDQDEQKRIAECLNSLDSVITAATQEIETFKNYKKGLMQQLFPSAEVVEP